MITSWIYLRLWFFPVHVIYRIIEEIRVWPEETYCLNVACMMVGFLMALSGMHVFWVYLMIKGLVKRIVKKDWRESVSLTNNENRFQS